MAWYSRSSVLLARASSFLLLVQALIISRMDGTRQRYGCPRYTGTGMDT